MRSLFKLTCTLFTAALMLSCGTGPQKEPEVASGEAQPPSSDTDKRPSLVLAAPGNVISLLDNDYLHVMRLYMKPGHTIAEHQAEHARLVYALGDLNLEVTRDGETTTEQLAAGEASSWQPGRYAITAVGDADSTALVLERTGLPLPEGSILPAETEVVPEPAAGTAEVLAANQEIDAVETSLALTEELKLPRVLPRVIYAHSEANLGIGFPNQVKEGVSLREGEVYWHEPEGCVIENRSVQPAQLVVFTLLH